MLTVAQEEDLARFSISVVSASGADASVGAAGGELLDHVATIFRSATTT